MSIGCVLTVLVLDFWCGQDLRRFEPLLRLQNSVAGDRAHRGDVDNHPAANHPLFYKERFLFSFPYHTPVAFGKNLFVIL